MSSSLPWIWDYQPSLRQYTRTGLLSLLILLSTALDCQAIEPTNTDALSGAASVQENDLIEVQVKQEVGIPSTSADSTQRQLQEMQEKMDAMQRDYNQRLQAMQTTITTLSAYIQKTGTTLPQTPAIDPADQDIGEELIFEADDVSSGQPSLLQDGVSSLNSGTQLSNAQTGSVWNRVQQMKPDISVLGDTIGYFANRSSDESRNRFSLREVEIAFQTAIDPYARADVFLTKPDDEEFEVEEGYVTLLALPYGFQSKIGKFRNAIGRINRIHGPELPQVDRPNVITNFFGDEGLAETGINVSKILPVPWYSTMEVEVGNGDNDVLLGAGTLARPLIVSHMNNYFDLTANTNVQVGLTGAFGSRGENDLGVREGRYRGVQGIDITYRWVPPKINRSFVWQTEFLTAQLENPTTERNRLFGGYSFVEAQLSRRWYAGVRLDYSQVPFEDVTECAFAPYINFWQSEFGRLRLEYKHTFRENALSSDQAWIQYTFTMGEHRPHPF